MKMEKVMHEFKHGTLHSGSKTGPKVKLRKQAIAIGLSEARKAGERVGTVGDQADAIENRKFRSGRYR